MPAKGSCCCEQGTGTGFDPGAGPCCMEGTQWHVAITGVGLCTPVPHDFLSIVNLNAVSCRGTTSVGTGTALLTFTMPTGGVPLGRARWDFTSAGGNLGYSVDQNPCDGSPSVFVLTRFLATGSCIGAGSPTTITITRIS